MNWKNFENLFPRGLHSFGRVSSLCDAVTATLTLMSYSTIQTTYKKSSNCACFSFSLEDIISGSIVFLLTYYILDFFVEEHNIKQLFISRTRTSVVSYISHTFHFASVMTAYKPDRVFFEIPYHKCSVCDSVSSAFTCNGCRRSFCVRHSAEHRNYLAGKLKTFFVRHEDMQKVNHGSAWKSTYRCDSRDLSLETPIPHENRTNIHNSSGRRK